MAFCKTIELTMESDIEFLKQQEKYSSIIIVDENRVLRKGFFETDDRPVIRAIIERKGWWRGRKGHDTGYGKYMFPLDIVTIIKEKPDWIKTKITSSKFGL